MQDAAELREIGKLLLKESDDPEIRKMALEYILEAFTHGDAEATFLVAIFIRDGILGPQNHHKFKDEQVLSLMCTAANRGCIQARAYLNSYCQGRYDMSFADVVSNNPSPDGLVDFNGQPIHINRRGMFTPVDAVLTTENGENVLTLSVCVAFYDSFIADDPEAFEDAVMDGICQWAGEYEVFGGQKLRVVVDACKGNNIIDKLGVWIINEDIGNKATSIISLFNKKRSRDFKRNLESGRSFITMPRQWKANSPKTIYFMSSNNDFNDYERIAATAKHEFGHALGLGDLYYSPEDNLSGVSKGTYPELDSYHLTNKTYNMVMCNNHGAVTNNDIEMVVLAFLDNEAQHYQVCNEDGKISVALGRGN